MNTAGKIILLEGDLTEMDVDAIVNAANNDLQLGGRTTAIALRSSTAHALRIAAQRSLKTIAFPAVGTGIAGFPLRECAEIMLREVVEYWKRPSSLQTVYFVLFDRASLEVFEQVWAEMQAQGKATP